MTHATLPPRDAAALDPVARGGSEMQRLSSKYTSMYKAPFPILTIAFTVLFLLGLMTGARGTPPFPFAVLGLIILLIYEYMLSVVVDEVWDAGDALIIRNKGQEDRIPLAAISDVHHSLVFNPPRVTLSLRSPNPFGPKIVFLAPIRFLSFLRDPLIEKLAERVAAAAADHALTG